MSFFSKAYHEIGLEAFINTPNDVKVLAIQRFIRLAAYGASTLILVLYLVALGNSVTKTGLFMTLTLIGDVLISLVLTVIADKIGRRRMLAFGSLLMAGSGVVFALSGSYWVLLLASIVGVISPSGNEIGPFKAIEESTIAQLTPGVDRSSVLAWYTLFGTAGVAIGTIVCGWVVRVLQTNHGWQATETYRVVFTAYAVMGILKFMLCLILSPACEVQHTAKDETHSSPETQPLLASQSTPSKGAAGKSWRPDQLLPSLSAETIALVTKLGFLFAIDSLASGLAPASWMIYFFNTKFGLKEERLGSLFFVTNILSSASNLGAASLARRIGLVKTMVFTHAPASIALALIPFPTNVIIAMALLIFRSSTNSMDQAPRQAFLAAAVLPAERTAVMGIINVVKTMSQSVGPVITGRLAGTGRFWVAFLVAGSLKIVYDILLLWMFLRYRTVEDKAQDQVVAETEREQAEGTDDRRDVA